MINSVVLVGRLTRDPELRYTPSGAAVASFTVAIDRRFTNQQGQREADFINCVMWRKAAENFANFTHKGSLVGIEGRIQTRSYENQQGQRVYVTEVLAENFSLLESRLNQKGIVPNTATVTLMCKVQLLQMICSHLIHLGLQQIIRPMMLLVVMVLIPIQTIVTMLLIHLPVVNRSISQMMTYHSKIDRREI